jgi:hypothetical protein
MLNHGEYEHWALEAWTMMSAIFFFSPSDQLGYMEDEVFQVGIASYLGQPCPLMAPVTGHYFGKHGKQLDWYGANLAAASLPGHGHRCLHNKLQPITQAMMKLGGILSTAEAVNFLADKIGHPYITSYVSHVSSHPNTRKAPHAIVPDIHAFNFPTGGQQVNDSGGTSPPEAFIEINTSRHAKANKTTKAPILGQWIDASMKSSYLMIKNSQIWIVSSLLMLLAT